MKAQSRCDIAFRGILVLYQLSEGVGPASLFYVKILDRGFTVPSLGPLLKVASGTSSVFIGFF